MLAGVRLNLYLNIFGEISVNKIGDVNIKCHVNLFPVSFINNADLSKSFFDHSIGKTG